jgi:biopolymer transport protein TolR
MSEINVTPFVDVMLVLLIIFMVTAPLLTVGVPLELPKSSAQQLGQSSKEPLTLSVNRDGKVFLQETEIELKAIGPKLAAITKSGYDEPIYVRADKDVDYGAVMRVMGEVSKAGFRKLSLLTDVDDKS